MHTADVGNHFLYSNFFLLLIVEDPDNVAEYIQKMYENLNKDTNQNTINRSSAKIIEKIHSMFWNNQDKVGNICEEWLAS